MAIERESMEDLTVTVAQTRLDLPMVSSNSLTLNLQPGGGFLARFRRN